MNHKQTFVLIHGAWHAAWCWERVASVLAQLGHNVLVPDLPGHGANRQAPSAVGLDDYVNSIAALIRQQSEPVTLVGHSMAGLIISQVAELIPDSIRKLVFVAAYITQRPQSLLTIAQQLTSSNMVPFLLINESLQEIQLQQEPGLVDIFFNRCNTKDIEHAMKNLQTQPLRPFTEEVQLGKNFSNVAKCALVCRYDLALLLQDQLEMCKTITDDIFYLDADHATYYSGSAQILEILLNAH